MIESTLALLSILVYGCIIVMFTRDIICLVEAVRLYRHSRKRGLL